MKELLLFGSLLHLTEMHLLYRFALSLRDGLKCFNPIAIQLLDSIFHSQLLMLHLARQRVNLLQTVSMN